MKVEGKAVSSLSYKTPNGGTTDMKTLDDCAEYIQGIDLPVRRQYTTLVKHNIGMPTQSRSESTLEEEMESLCDVIEVPSGKFTCARSRINMVTNGYKSTATMWCSTAMPSLCVQRASTSHNLGLTSTTVMSVTEYHVPTTME